MTESKPSEVYTGVAESSARQVESQRKRKATDVWQAKPNKIHVLTYFAQANLGFHQANLKPAYYNPGIDSAILSPL